MSDALVSWQPEVSDLLPVRVKSAGEITGYAVQLSNRDKGQISNAFKMGNFEMAVTYLWGKTINALKKELSNVGLGLLGEMVGKSGIDETDDVDDILTAKDAIRLAEELGIVSQTDALRLRHTYELVLHFSQMEADQSDSEELEESEAISCLKACVRSVLGRPKVQVAKKFIEFREALEGETLILTDNRVQTLLSSPYFFKKLTVSVLMNSAKTGLGARLEHALANINVIIPAIWPSLRDTEKWQIGRTYAETYADGKTHTISGLKSALLKVKGFDYVPENLRSDTFISAAQAIVKAHEGFYNFYNELEPVKNLSKLGSTIPTPALPACISALLCVVLGNHYGVARSAQPDALNLLRRLSAERWAYYLNQVFPGDTRILNKLLDDNPLRRWMQIAIDCKFSEVNLKERRVSTLITASINGRQPQVQTTANQLLNDYYGKRAR
jgi:hypothetical protein